MTGTDARVHAMAAHQLIERLETAARDLPPARDPISEKSALALLAEAVDGARTAYLRLLAIAAILERNERS